MKKLLLFPLFIASILSFSFISETKQIIPEDESERSKGDSVIQYYFITKNAKDSSLTSLESKFAFSFKFENGQAVKSSITMSYNGIQNVLQCDANGKASLYLKPGKYKFQFFLNENYDEVYTDSISIAPGFRTEMQVNFYSSLIRVISDKPVIYVYPQHTMPVSIDLDLKGKLGFTYPEYKNGWKFTADSDGTIHMNDKKYHYLFWDGTTEINKNKIAWNEGFVVKKDSLVTFFEENLSLMGLNSKEIEDYITYWCPRMNVNEVNCVHFLFNETYNEYAALNVNPKPDQQFRVYMLWSKAEPGVQLNKQVIPSFQRSGFTIVEWGGAEMKEWPAMNSVQ